MYIALFDHIWACAANKVLFQKHGIPILTKFSKLNICAKHYQIIFIWANFLCVFNHANTLSNGMPIIYDQTVQYIWSKCAANKLWSSLVSVLECHTNRYHMYRAEGEGPTSKDPTMRELNPIALEFFYLLMTITRYNPQCTTWLQAATRKR